MRLGLPAEGPTDASIRRPSFPAIAHLRGASAVDCRPEPCPCRLPLAASLRGSPLGESRPPADTEVASVAQIENAAPRCRKRARQPEAGEQHNGEPDAGAAQERVASQEMDAPSLPLKLQRPKMSFETLQILGESQGNHSKPESAIARRRAADHTAAFTAVL